MLKNKPRGLTATHQAKESSVAWPTDKPLSKETNRDLYGVAAGAHLERFDFTPTMLMLDQKGDESHFTY